MIFHRLYQNQTVKFIYLETGKNIEYIARDESHTFLPDNIYGYMKSKRYFEVGVGQGTGESILSLNEELKGEILRRAETDIEFARGC
jgi:hypothetical protein